MISSLLSILVLVLGVVILVPPVRRALISNRLLKIFRKILPQVSQTEQEALDAGTVWWEGDLFSGRPNWNKLLAYPKPKLTAEEKAFLAGPVEELCAMLDEWRITRELHDLPPDVWQFIKDNGFFGMIIPKQYGGRGFSALAHSEVVMKISSRSGTAAVSVMVPNSLGPSELLLQYGTEEQKNHYLPRLAKGLEIPCFALTGPDAGSDAGSIPDSGIVCYGEFNGDQQVLGMRVTWEKRYITLGPGGDSPRARVQAARPGWAPGQQGRSRHHACADSHQYSRRQHRPPPFPARCGISEWPQFRKGCIHSDGLGDRRA